MPGVQYALVMVASNLFLYFGERSNIYNPNINIKIPIKLPAITKIRSVRFGFRET